MERHKYLTLQKVSKIKFESVNRADLPGIPLKYMSAADQSVLWGAEMIKNMLHVLLM